MKTGLGNAAISALLAAVLFFSPGASAQAQAVRVSNLQFGEVLHYPVALIEGQVDLPDGVALSLRNGSSNKPDNQFTTRVSGGRFKALMELVPGDNQLAFESEGGPISPFRLRYEPMTNPQVVRIIYVVDSKGETTYPTQLANDPQNFRAKLQTAARLIQTFSAESMNDAGWGRKTFRLEEDERGEVIVHLVRAPRRAVYYQSISEAAIGGVIRGFVNPQFPTGNARNLVINNTAGYDPATRQTLGHCANTAAGTAVLSALDLFTWPASLQEVQPAFSNATPTDWSQVSDDSAGRGRLWAVAATTIGVSLHELGHTFDIPHSEDELGIMARGHDHFNRSFTLVEPPYAGHDAPSFPADDQKARFEAGNAARLAFHPFFQPAVRPASNLAAPSFALDFPTGDIEVKAPTGLRALSVERNGILRGTLSFRDEAPPKQFFERAALQQIAKATDFSLVAIDNEGRSTFIDSPGLADQRAFVRSWHISPLIPWPDTTGFPPMNEARLRELTEQTAASPVRLSFSSLIDLDAALRASGPTDHKVTYAYRAIETLGDRRVLLLTGSDDALRVWVNGKLVAEKGVFREARIDADQTWVQLRRGHNDVLVEVVNIGGGWGFYFRMVDETNTWLHLAPDGSLARLTEFYDPQRFARAWQFAAQTEPYPAPLTPTNRDKARAMLQEAQQVVELETELSARPVEHSRSPFIDLRAHYQGREAVEASVTRARAVIRSDRARAVTLLTGSDDTIRVWVNGELKIERAAPRAAQPDDDRTPITLRAGENSVIVEVSTGGGGWGFYLRFDEDGAPLWISDDGTLSQTRN